MTRLAFRLCLGLGLVAGCAGLALSETLVVPGGLPGGVGDGNSSLPFFISDIGAPSMRYQQLYAWSEFAQFSGPQTITAITFRPDEVVGFAFLPALLDVQIEFSTTPAFDLSTTPSAPWRLGSDFDKNVGPDMKIVFPRRGLEVSSSFTPSGLSPITINLSQSFTYDPCLTCDPSLRKNLLMDVRNFGGGETTPFDFDSTTLLQRVWAEDVNAETGFTENGGLVTQFTYGPPQELPPAIPEPASLLLLGTGLSLIGLAGRRRRK